MRLPGFLAFALSWVLLCGCGPQDPGAAPTTAPSVPGWSVVPTTTEQPEGDDFDVDAALQLIEQQGFTPDPPEQPLAGPMRAIHSTCTGSANGRCQVVFVFDGQRIAGQLGGLSQIVEQDGTKVVISYFVYQPGDAGCCPTGEPKLITYRLVDGQVQQDPPR